MNCFTTKTQQQINNDKHNNHSNIYKHYADAQQAIKLMQKLK